MNNQPNRHVQRNIKHLQKLNKYIFPERNPCKFADLPLNSIYNVQLADAALTVSAKQYCGENPRNR